MLFSHDPNVIVYRDVRSMSQAAAEMFGQIADRAMEERKQVLVALSGGSTPKRLFQILSRSPCAQSLPWENLHFFWCDERLVPPDHPQSNFGQAKEWLFSQVSIPGENLHRIQGELAPAQAVEEYRRVLGSFSDGEQKWPRFDLAYLGLGADGHTASLFPGAITPEEEIFPALAVTADYQGRPAGRVTLTPLALNSARNLIFMVSGKDKAHAIYQTLHGEKDLEKWPAQRIQPLDGEVIWLLDDQVDRG
jgi:6-phosphogluconolactonase